MGRFGALVVFTASIALGHGTETVQTEQEAIKKLVPSVGAKSIGWNGVAAASLPKLERLKKLAHADVAVAQRSAIHLGRGGRGATSSRHGRDREQQGGV